MFRNMGIAYKLILIGVLILLIPLSFVGFLSVKESTLGLEKLENEQLLTRSSTIASGVENVIKEELKLIRSFSADSELGRLMTEIKEQGSDSSALLSLRLRMSMFREIDPLNIQTCLIADSRGICLTASEEGYAGIDLSEREYFRKSMEKEVLIGQLEINKATGEPFISASAPILGEDGDVLGVIVNVLNYQLIQNLVKDEAVGDSGYASILDARGIVVAHPNKKYVSSLDMTTMKGMEKLVEEMLGGRSGIESYIFEGIQKTAGYAPIPTAGWSVVLAIPDTEYMKPVYRVRNYVFGVGIISFILAVIIYVFFSRSLVKPILEGVKFAEVISRGDLTMKMEEKFLKKKDETGKLSRAMDEMKKQLVEIVVNVNAAAAQVASGSVELSSTAQEMSQGATEQASSAEEISASMEEMSATLKQTADNAMQTEAIARQSAKNADEGGAAVAETVDAMRNIADKIKIIEEIARSTNLLSLNASIEAARAGEYGKGFAVVASEVGKLAERSQKAAGEISELAVVSVGIAEKAGELIERMLPDNRHTAELVQEISASNSELESGAQQITSAIMLLDQVVQQNAAASEESASMAEELSSQAEKLQTTMQFFTTDDSFLPAEKRFLNKNDAVVHGTRLTLGDNTGGGSKKTVQNGFKTLRDPSDGDFIEF